MNLRLDRLATLYLVHPLKIRYPKRSLRIPILMYHSVSDENEGGVHPYYRITTSPHVFGEHIRYLSAHGYQTASLNDAVRGFAESSPSQRRVVITFDDGYADFLNNAFPVLDEFGFTATVFLPTAYIGDKAKHFNGKSCLTWSQVRDLFRAGIKFGSHTVTHPRLDSLTNMELDHEIAGSKHVIEDKLGCAIDSFSYPFAFPESKTGFKQVLHDLLCKTGYRQGVCTSIGTEDGRGDRFFMKRLPVNSCDDLPLFAAKLAGDYNWLHGLQYAYKQLTRSGQ